MLALQEASEISNTGSSTLIPGLVCVDPQPRLNPRLERRRRRVSPAAPEAALHHQLLAGQSSSCPPASCSSRALEGSTCAWRSRRMWTLECSPHSNSWYSLRPKRPDAVPSANAHSTQVPPLEEISLDFCTQETGTVFTRYDTYTLLNIWVQYAGWLASRRLPAGSNWEPVRLILNN